MVEETTQDWVREIQVRGRVFLTIQLGGTKKPLWDVEVGLNFAGQIEYKTYTSDAMLT